MLILLASLILYGERNEWPFSLTGAFGMDTTVAVTSLLKQMLRSGG